MNTEFGELAQAQYRARHTRRRIFIAIGLALIAAGYLLMSISPDTKSEWALARAVGGLLCIVVGAGMAILPLLSRDTGRD